jgi:subtilase family serine protease
MGRFTLRRRRLLIGLVAGASALTTITATATAPSALAAPGRHVIAGSVPQWLQQARTVGDAPSGNRVGFGVLLKMRDADTAVSTLQGVSDPSGAEYGKWLSSEQFRARFAPTASDITAVRDWLTAQGFRVEKTLPSGMYIEASGTNEQIEKTFATTVKTYSYRGRTVRANASALSFPTGTPAAVTGVVAGVLGVDQGSQLHQPADIEPGPPPGGRYGVQPCSDYYGQKIATDQPAAYGKKQPYVVCGYGPQQYQSAYGESDLLRAGIDGRGVTVAITDAYAAPTILADAQKYNQVHHQPALKSGQFRQITPAADGYDMTDECDAQGWYGEETLDVEAVHAMAPGARIVYVGAKNCVDGLDNAWAETIDSHVADIISNSWGNNTDDIKLLGEDYVQFYNQFALEAALTGITVNFSSGDAGDLTAGGTDLPAKTVGFPADQPYVTSVGGTSVGIGDKGQWLWEHGWQSDYANLVNGAWDGAPGTYSSGGGGGTSFIYPQPFYQKGKVPAADSTYFGGAPMRTVPDISMAGDANTGFRVGQTQEFPDGTYWDQYRIGGTSLSSPLLAGVIAVANQAGHRPLGFVNPLYYRLLRTPALHDITAPGSPLAEVRTNYTNGVDGSAGRQYLLRTVDVQSTTLHSRPGYDTETGVGSPHGPLFFLGALAGSQHH